MKGVCPGCGFAGDLEAFLNDAKWREALAPALALPSELAPLILQYLCLHSPAKQALRAEKAARLLAELADAISRARVNRDGVEHVAPVAIWKGALEAVMAARDAGTLSPPLKGHGYLYQITASLAGSSAARAQQQHEAGRRGEPPVGYSPAHAATRPDPAAPAAPRPPSPSLKEKRPAPVKLADTLKALNLKTPPPTERKDCETERQD